MVACTKCGVNVTAKFCTGCGTPAPPPGAGRAESSMPNLAASFSLGGGPDLAPGSAAQDAATLAGGYRKGDRVKSLLDFQFVGANKYVELRQGAPIALTQQALPVGSNHRRKWEKKDDSSDSGSEDDDETYMPASNLVNLPGVGWGKAAGAGNLGDAGGSSGKRSSAGSISKGDIGTVVGPCEEESIAEVDVPGAAPCCTW